MRVLVSHWEKGHPFDFAAAGRVLAEYTRIARILGEDVQLPPDFADALTAAMLSDKASRRGPKVNFSAYQVQLHAFGEFEDLREAGVGYEDALIQVAERHGKSPETIRTWIKAFCRD